MTTVHEERRRTEAYARGGVSPEALVHADPILTQPAMLYVEGLDVWGMAGKVLEGLREHHGLALAGAGDEAAAQLLVQAVLEDAHQDQLDDVEGVT